MVLGLGSRADRLAQEGVEPEGERAIQKGGGKVVRVIWPAQSFGAVAGPLICYTTQMPEDENNIDAQIKKLEEDMTQGNFWEDKVRAQAVLRELADLKNKKEGLGKYDKGNAILTIISGAGGDDAEDFARMLSDMYLKYISKRGWKVILIHENKNDHGGFRNISVEISSPDKGRSGGVTYITSATIFDGRKIISISPIHYIYFPIFSI